MNSLIIKIQYATLAQLLLDSQDMDKIPESNHRLLHIKATTDTFVFDGVQFASRYVEEELKHQLLKYDQSQVRYLDLCEGREGCE